MKQGFYDSFLEDKRPLFCQRLSECYAIIEKHTGHLLQDHRRVDGYYIWLRFINEIDTLKLYNECREITFLPGHFFDNGDKHHIHLAPFADSLDNFRKGVQYIAKQAESQAKILH
jgi:DNA-binding transcriptional MocR family regulator